MMSWQETPEKIQTLNRIPASSSIPNRLSKKDVFMSRGWGAGGMPFSVLYMSPPSLRGNHNSPPGSVLGEAPKPELPNRSSELIPVSSKNIPQNYRETLRNGSTVQPRRQYSIIPQLFISYGWGPSGK